MSRTLLFITGWILVGPCLIASAQEEFLINDDFESKLGSIKNPFESQLPQEEEEEEEELSDAMQEPDPTLVDNGSTADETQPTQPPISNTETVADTQPPIIDELPEEIIPLPELTVTGVIWNSDRPQAIINGYIVNIGDTISEITITDIQKAGIEGEFHGRTINIKTQRSQL